MSVAYMYTGTGMKVGHMYTGKGTSVENMYTGKGTSVENMYTGKGKWHCHWSVAHMYKIRVSGTVMAV